MGPDTLIEEAGLETRTYHCLRKHMGGHPVTLADVACLSEEDLLEIRHFGSRCLRDVVRRLGQVGLSLGNSPAQRAAGRQLPLVVKCVHPKGFHSATILRPDSEGGLRPLSLASQHTLTLLLKRAYEMADELDRTGPPPLPPEEGMPCDWAFAITCLRGELNL